MLKWKIKSGNPSELKLLELDRINGIFEIIQEVFQNVSYAADKSQKNRSNPDTRG